ncbi:hypothetical protein K505DRAFT_43547 [Melanomma pulvis-pyrius CBS 109.77]|uniref:Uncharacterized protein n=1 Tax=Melanomma pulvis-pyrius CBS 109.77 TaxID=1314802 RepID=A0A6A6XXT5_9PLEO|nr:hypothetical protein K505DRAFT_43547 [Melanomma pulvis-pyrius CBS 109.77]
MGDGTSPPLLEYPSVIVDSIDIKDVAPAAPPVETHAREDREDSKESVIIDDHRSPRDSTRQPMRQQPTRKFAQQSIEQSIQRPVPQNVVPPSASPERIRKKPGPKPWATKPLTKNDMAAKKELIAEIEKYWGKGFIKAFIPKCHRPLVKRGKGGKRSAFRQSENDPKKWMPSVLKAVLMIAKKTDDKQWLKEQMRDVVTYRIKHTGNRKPQLVTTDFDVIEDVFDSGWTVAQSFAIRYKHLLMNRAGDIETDADIAHIFGEVNRGSEDGSGGEDGDDDEDDGEEEYGEDGDMREEPSGDETEQELSNGYFQTSGYIQSPQYPLPPPPQQGYGQPHPKTGRQNRQQVRGNERPPPPPAFAPPPRPRPNPRPSQTPQQFTPSPSYAASEDPPYSFGGNKRRPRSPALYSLGENKRGRSNILTIPSHQASRLHVQPNATQYSLTQPASYPGTHKIKTEPGLEKSGFSYESFDEPENYLGPPDDEQEEHDILKLEWEAAEAEANRARLKLRFAESQRRKKM